MPEKPEVVTVCKVLEEKIIGKKITGCNVYWDNIIEVPNVSEFKNDIIGENIHSVNSKGKFIVIELDKYYLLIHLRMEGKFTFRNIGDEFSKHEHVEFILDDVISWRYHDVRKFGRMYLLLKGEAYSIKPLKELGYEIVSIGDMKRKFTLSYIDKAVASEWTVLPNVRSPQSPIVKLSSLPSSFLIVIKSNNVWVG